ncbi:metallophosphoesterase family protein [Euzebyella saccharophila]|uniref:Metallophosphoesterase family protein n=1 Tax=Euzebyella saccharophila TaxID=679664 RepID=A0ABV8K112_9FLAO|nr:metallophosphoesterase [Euzebyella saccharophila]
MGRRKFLKQSSAICASTLIVPLDPYFMVDKNIRIGLASDSHYADREVAGTRFYRGALEKIQEFVSVMNKEKVDFVVHLGDFKDEDESKDEQKTLGYLQKIETEFVKFKGDTFHCIGNHDVDSITKQQFIKNVTNTGIVSDKGYYSFDRNGFHFIVLDGNHTKEGRDHFYKLGQDWQDTNLGREQLDWLKKDLESNTLPVMVFCHHPLYEFFRDEHKYHVNDYLKAQKLFEASGKVLAVFQGHVHAEDHISKNGIHYLTVLGMVDFEGLENNSFSVVEIKGNKLKLKGYKRSSSHRYGI